MSQNTIETSTNNNILTQVLQRVDPAISSFVITNHIEQGSAEGFVIEAKTTSGKDERKTRHLFVKFVNPKKYSHKVWADLRRTIHYTRTEVRFYTEILPLLKKSKIQYDNDKEDWMICPEIYLAEYNLNGLMNEDESTEAQEATILNQGQINLVSATSSITIPQYDENNTTVLEGKYGVLVMDNVREVNQCFQRAPLRKDLAVASVNALAKFHAAGYQNQEILSKVSERLCRYGGSYHLKNRNPKEMAHLTDAWDGFVVNIGPHAPEGFFNDPVRKNLGSRLYDMAEYISKELSPDAGSPFATIVHGDYKAMNIFFRGKEDNMIGTPLLIDFASTGVGLGMSDLALHIAHIALPEDLEDGLEDLLFTKYYNSLHQHLQQKELHTSYSQEDALRHYKLATVDYFRFILGRQWKGATLDVFEKRNKDTNFAMVNRCVKAAIKFVERTDLYLREIETEMTRKTKNDVN